MPDSETKTAAPPVPERGWMPFWSLRNEIDDLFDEFYRSGWGGWPRQRIRHHGVAAPRRAGLPAIDVIDKEVEVKLIADLPGVSEKDIDVRVTDGTLTISGEKREEIEEGDKDGERYVAERRFGAFTRSIPLPEGIDRDRIDASFKNGVLTVRLPKTPEARSPARKIAIRAES